MREIVPSLPALPSRDSRAGSSLEGVWGLSGSGVWDCGIGDGASRAEGLGFRVEGRSLLDIPTPNP